jgi:hypothetical protein
LRRTTQFARQNDVARFDTCVERTTESDEQRGARAGARYPAGAARANANALNVSPRSTGAGGTRFDPHRREYP